MAELPFRPPKVEADLQPQIWELGIDLGSTYSGATYCLISPSNPFCTRNIVYNVGGYKAALQSKVTIDGKFPTLLRYDVTGICVAWGHAVEGKLQSSENPGYVVKLFKTGLDCSERTVEEPTELDDILRRLGKSIDDVFVDFFRLWLIHIKNQLSLVGYRSCDVVHFTVTVPAAWKMAGRRRQEMAFLGAKSAAGFAAEDTVALCTEPEAAAAYVLATTELVGVEVTMDVRIGVF